MSATARVLADLGIEVLALPVEDGSGWRLALLTGELLTELSAFELEDRVNGLAAELGAAITRDLNTIRVPADRLALPTPERTPR